MKSTNFDSVRIREIPDFLKLISLFLIIMKGTFAAINPPFSLGMELK